jgi:hypothetical protein
VASCRGGSAVEMARASPSRELEPTIETLGTSAKGATGGWRELGRGAAGGWRQDALRARLRHPSPVADGPATSPQASRQRHDGSARPSTRRAKPLEQPNQVEWRNTLLEVTRCGQQPAAAAPGLMAAARRR